MDKPKQRRIYKAKMRRITLSIPDGLLQMIDEAAAKDFTSRSDIIRMAALWYLRPQGRDLNEVDPEAILKTLQHRRARAGLKKMLRDADNDGFTDDPSINS
jgi:metal-responsive CopG/Arc/MetJ family transcriptional regulator